jgi:two-component system, cell cycle sensor histidine kinase and response regulator CckA
MNLTHILVVEDESIVALDLTQQLTRWGYTVTRITSGAEAVAVADTLRPELVLMDVHLPGAMDGLHAATHIWAQWRIPIIYLTGHADSAFLAGVKTPPPVFTLSKPFTKAALQEILSRALAEWSGQLCL